MLKLARALHSICPGILSRVSTSTRETTRSLPTNCRSRPLLALQKCLPAFGMLMMKEALTTSLLLIKNYFFPLFQPWLKTPRKFLSIFSGVSWDNPHKSRKPVLICDSFLLAAFKTHCFFFPQDCPFRRKKNWYQSTWLHHSQLENYPHLLFSTTGCAFFKKIYFDF